MSGGILQMVVQGEEDVFLTRDPQITFFKIMYRRHTNFSREEIPLHFIHEPNFGKRSTCLVSRDSGDLIDKMCLKITLPSIPKFSNSISNSASNNSDNSVNLINPKIAWIRRIGFAMIKIIEIEIDNKVVDRHYGEWMYLWATLTTKNIGDNGLSKLIGDVPELFDYTESKDEYILYIPLYFWFCRTSGLSLPMISLQLSDIKINLEFHDIEDCYTTSPTHYIKCKNEIANFLPYEYIYQKGTDNIDRYGIFSHYDSINKRLYYTSVNSDKLIGVPYMGSYDNTNPNLSDTDKSMLLSSPKSDKYLIKGVSSDFAVKPDLCVKSFAIHKRSLKNIRLKDCVLLTDYVFIDDDERQKFAQSKHDYLIEQLHYTPDIQIDGSNPKIKLDIDQTCKLQIWVTQLDYVKNFNDRFNYTDSHIYKREYDRDYTDPTKIKLFDDTKTNELIGNSLIDFCSIRLNSQIRLSIRDSKYYEFIQPIQHTTNSLPKGSSMYSYAITPLDTAPSGTSNMSQIELIELGIKMNHKVNTEHKAKLRGYALCYNVWRVDNGLSATIFIK